MSKVWIVIVYYDYEGYASPDSVWDTEEGAKARQAQLMEEPMIADCVEILDYNINEVLQDRV